MTRVLGLWVPALAAVALICAGPAAGKGLFDSIKGGFSSGDEKQEQNELEAFKASSGLAEPCGGDGGKTLMNARVEQGLGTVRQSQLEAYLNAILAKLLAVSPRPQCRVTVFVAPHDSAEAVALADGGILVTLGFLHNLKSEDEVAALLGHELSHILKNHQASDSFVDTQDQFLKGMDTANMAGSMFAGVVDPGLSQTLDTASAVGTAVYGISDGLIAPAWTREQEDEADLLGVDLAAAAGYNPSAMTGMLEVIKAQEATRQEADAERERLRKERLKNSALQTVARTDTSSTTSIIGSIAKLATVAAGAASEGQKQHRSAEEREKSVKEYVRKYHSKERRRHYAEQPWQAELSQGKSGAMFAHYQAAAEARRLVYTGGDVGEAEALARRGLKGEAADDAYPRLAYAEVRLKQGRQKEAIRTLEAARQEPDAPWQIYRSLADLQLKSGNVKGATATVAAADQSYGEPLGIAPYAIKVYRAAGDRRMVNRYLDRCNDKGTRQHMEVCLAAAGISKEQYERGKLGR